MVLNSKRLTFLISIIPFVSVLFLASFFKVSFIVGSKMAFFKGSDLFGPALGAIGGTSLVFLLTGLRSLYASINPLLFFFRHMPGLFGALYWQSNSWIIRALVPVSCIALFVMHPVGYQAYGYTFFWFIPLALYFFNISNRIADAFGSTLVVHAVGSVIWLYTVPMEASIWWALIPVVIVERCCAAGGMILICNAYNAWKSFIISKSIAQKAFFKRA